MTTKVDGIVKNEGGIEQPNSGLFGNLTQVTNIKLSKLLEEENEENERKAGELEAMLNFFGFTEENIKLIKWLFEGEWSPEKEEVYSDFILLGQQISSELSSMNLSEWSSEKQDRLLYLGYSIVGTYEKRELPEFDGTNSYIALLIPGGTINDVYENGDGKGYFHESSFKYMLFSK